VSAHFWISVFSSELNFNPRAQNAVASHRIKPPFQENTSEIRMHINVLIFDDKIRLHINYRKRLVSQESLNGVGTLEARKKLTGWTGLLVTKPEYATKNTPKKRIHAYS